MEFTLLLIVKLSKLMAYQALSVNVIYFNNLRLVFGLNKTIYVQ